MGSRRGDSSIKKRQGAPCLRIVPLRRRDSIVAAPFFYLLLGGVDVGIRGGVGFFSLGFGLGLGSLLVGDSLGLGGLGVSDSLVGLGVGGGFLHFFVGLGGSFLFLGLGLGDIGVGLDGGLHGWRGDGGARLAQGSGQMRRWRRGWRRGWRSACSW